MNMNTQQIVIIVVIGIVAGWLASLVVGGGGILRYLITGILGAFVGGWLFSAAGWKLNLGSDIAEQIVDVGHRRDHPGAAGTADRLRVERTAGNLAAQLRRAGAGASGQRPWGFETDRSPRGCLGGAAGSARFLLVTAISARPKGRAAAAGGRSRYQYCSYQAGSV